MGISYPPPPFYSDAPSDGSTYGRNNNAWEAVIEGSGPQWIQLYNAAIGVVTNIDVAIPAGASDILAIARNVTLSGAGHREIIVSTNGGGSFFNASGDFVQILDTGIESAAQGAVVHGTASAAARSIGCLINKNNLAGPKPCIPFILSSSTIQLNRLFVADLVNPINVIRLIAQEAVNLTGGNFYVAYR